MDRLTCRTKEGYVSIDGLKSLYGPNERKGAYMNNVVLRLADYEDAEEQGNLIMLPPKEKQTNADRIRAMNNTELAAYLYSLDDVGVGFCLDKGRCMEESDEDVVIPTDDDCMACMIAWIQSPAEGGDER